MMIAGGDRDTWPRDGNRPVYFWISLKSGRVVRFPIGWDLEYFSGDQRVAVFHKPQEKRYQKRPLQAVDMETGNYVERIPDRRTEPYVWFNWSETQVVKPLYERRAKTGSRDNFAGISVRGLVLPFDLHLKETYRLSEATAEDGFVGFRLRPEGASAQEPGPFWLVALEQPSIPKHVASTIAGFAMLERGNCVYATTGHGPKRASAEAFFRFHGEKSTWNVLDGVQRLSELDKQFADKDYVKDKMTVRMIDGFGSHDSLALCLFSHFRRDMRAVTLPLRGKKPGRTLKLGFPI